MSFYIDFFADNIVMKVNFAPYFIAPAGKANVQTVADHVEHIASVAGKRQSVTPYLSSQYIAQFPYFQALGLEAILMVSRRPHGDWRTCPNIHHW